MAGAEDDKWVQVEHRRKQTLKPDLRHTSLDVSSTRPQTPRYFHVKPDEKEETFSVPQAALDKSKEREKLHTPETSSSEYHDVRSLIGKPVIRRNAPVQPVIAKSNVPFDKKETERRGGLLFVNVKDPAFSGESPFEKNTTFDSSKEVWPQLDSVQLEESSGITNSSDAIWSRVVKAPPKPRPPMKQKLQKEDNAVSSERDEEMPGEEEEGETKRKKKKKKKEKLPETQTLDLGAMIDALKSSKKNPHPAVSPKTKTTPPSKVKTLETTSIVPRNMLDSSAPTTRRGKEREAPKKKKLTPMRKAIIKEKADRKNAMEEGQPIPSILDVLSQQKEAVKVITPPGLHNRKFRDYCTHLITPEINKTVEAMLKDLVRFQDRVYKNEPLKLKNKRRYICGLREVAKHLELKRLKCVIVPPNLDKIESPGGVYQAIEKIICTCDDQGLPVIYALTRRQLAFVLKKKFHIGCVGIISFAGAEDKYKRMIELVAAARKEYTRKANNLLHPSPSKTPTVVSECAKEEPLNMETEESDQVLLEEESEGEEEENEEEPMSISTSEWEQVFDSSLHSVHQSIPPSKAFSWNLSAPPFVPNLD